jgi:Ran GTPase-activating protein (RanGAP) involved in mRNA processing and transport
VFQFYAAFTKLKSPGIRQVIDRIVEAKSKPLLVSLLRCLHEAQDPDLCLYVAERLEYKVDLSETSLSPLDCLSIGFLLSSVAGKKIIVTLSQCQIGDLGAKCLTKYLSVSSYTDLVTINLKGNDIQDEGASHVAKMLYFIERLHLDMSENPIGATGTSCLFQAVRETTILKTLVLIGCTIIADLLPVENTQKIATGQRATTGHGVLWVFDDHKPHLYSIFLSPNSNIECFVIVTSLHIIDTIIRAKYKPLLVSLLHCLHEAQDPALCLYVADRLEYELDLRDTALSPQDYLCVSFFLSSLSGKESTVSLRHCSIGDLGAKALTKFLHSDVHYASNVAIDICNSCLNQKDALHVARILYFVEHLYLSHNPFGDTGASLISEAVRETATLRTLILCNCSITSRGAEGLSRALAQNNSLEKLDISLNNLGDTGISHVAEALKQNKQLKDLWIGECGMTDKGAASLASALTVNNSLKMLHMGSVLKEALTEDGLSIIAHSLVNKSLFVKLAIPTCFSSTTADRLSREINEARKRNGLSPIKIEGEYTVWCVDLMLFMTIS